MGKADWIPGSSPMPPDARSAAVATFARIIRERHPGMAVLPLPHEGLDRPIPRTPPRDVARPFVARKAAGALHDQGAASTGS